MANRHPSAAWILLILVSFIGDEALGCASRGNSNDAREQKPKHRDRYHFNDPRYRDYLPIDRKHRSIVPADKLLVPEYELTAPSTGCGETLCPFVANYPLKEINKAVDQAREILRSGIKFTAFRYKGITFNNFTSKYDSFWYGERAPDHQFVDETSDCGEQVKTIYPQEGYSSDDKKTYYVVNVPTMYRGLTSMDCQSDNQMCIKSNDLSAASRSCRQMYREEQLLALPTGKDYFDVEDFELKMFHVRTGCACISSP